MLCEGYGEWIVMAFINTQIVNGEFHGFMVQVPTGADMTRTVQDALRTTTRRFVTNTKRRDVLFEKIKHLKYHVCAVINPSQGDVTQLAICQCGRGECVHSRFS